KPDSPGRNPRLVGSANKRNGDERRIEIETSGEMTARSERKARALMASAWPYRPTRLRARVAPRALPATTEYGSVAAAHSRPSAAPLSPSLSSFLFLQTAR